MCRIADCPWLGLVASMATLLSLSLLIAEPSDAMEAQSEAADQPPPIHWLADYVEAMDTANGEGKMLLLFFCGDSGGQAFCSRWEAETLADPAVRRKLPDYVCAKLPLDATVQVDGQPVTLLQHSAFREMLGRPGIAILDFAHRDTPHHGNVVSTFPLLGPLWYTPQQVAVMLDLPTGTITQRTLIYAVRVHPERPASTSGEFDPYLAQEAESHSQYQADIRLQGHHRWAARFPRISAHLPGRCAAEVCAESWPGQNLVEAAIECVRCWRLSSGHWNAVRARHRVYGYDMKRGCNGVWYATGIFDQND